MKRRSRQDVRMLGLGLVLSAAASLGAWSVGRDVDAGIATHAAGIEALNAAVGTGVKWDLPVTSNARVDKFIDFLSGRNADKTRLWLERSGTYTPMIRAELRKRGMPEDLIYLAFIESGFSPNAYSRAKAAGLWQFIAETGQRYGLEVSSYVDERRDPIKATGAALDFLQNLHDKFGSWYLAAAAYNTGPNRVERILRERAGGARGDEDLYWAIAPYLPQETRDYVPLMLAAGHIGKEPAKYGFDNLEYGQPLAFNTVSVPGSTSLTTVAKAAGVDVAKVRELNPQLIRGVTPPKRTYAVRVPTSVNLAQFNTNFASAQAEAARQAKLAAAKMGKHVVKRGESFSTIARKHHISVAKLQKANPGISAKRLQVGKVLRVPA